MLHELAASRSEREVWWIHGARGPQEDPLAAEAHALLASLPRAREHLFYSSAGGRLSPDRLRALGLPPGATAYICGPATFMSDMEYALTAVGLDPGRIRTELFGALPAITPGVTGQPGLAAAPAGRPAGHRPAGHVRAQRPVRAVQHGPPQRAGTRRRLRCPDSLRLPDRRVPHLRHPAAVRRRRLPPDPLEQPAGGQVLICCAQPRTDIVLDL